MAQIKSWSEIAKKYPTSEYIHVLPAEDMLIEHDAPMWRLDVTVVAVDPDAKSDVYPISDGVMGLAKASLERLCAAADVSLMPVPVPEIPGRRTYAFAAFIKQRGGSLRTVTASREWEAELEREKCLRAASTYADKCRQKGWKLNVPGVGMKPAGQCSPQELEAAIRDRFEGEWLREREFGPSKVETKAANRARRSILGIAASYSYDDLKRKRFVVARWVFEPDCSDPAIKMLVVQDGLVSQRRAFALPAPSVEQPLALPAGQVLVASQHTATPEEIAAEDAEDVVGLIETSAGQVDAATGELFQRSQDPEDAAINEEFLRARVARVKCIPELINTRKKYAPAADNDGWLPEFNAICDAKHAELSGDPPTPSNPPADTTSSAASAAPDDVDAIADDELELYLDMAVPKYAGPRAADLKASIESAKAAKDVKKLRVLLRAIYRHTN